VEDDEDLSFALIKMLERELFSVVVVVSAEEAMQTLQQQRFDLVVTDLLLPGMDGAELCRMIRKDPREPKLPIILLTAMPTQMGLAIDDIDLNWAPADRYIDKATSLDEILETIRELVT